ncbi:MAG: GNAT family N-acetyltransferase [Jatrophihabitans sp.]
MQVHLMTDRLLLRRFTDADVDALTDLDGDPEVMHFVTGGRPTTRSEIVDDVLPAFLGYYARSAHFGFWAALVRPTATFIGWFHLRSAERDDPDDPELGYRLRRDAWGLGYATEGSRALIDKAFTETTIRRVHAETMTVHTASRRVMENAGLRHCRTFHQDWPFPIPGDEYGDVEYALTRAEWLAARGAEPARA